MVRRRSSDLLNRVPETHHLECPRCRRHNIVGRGEGKYVCLNCGWRRDVDDWGDGPPPFFVLMAIAIILMLIFLGG